MCLEWAGRGGDEPDVGVLGVDRERPRVTARATRVGPVPGQAAVAAPRRLRRNLLERAEFLPRVAVVAASEEPTRFRSGVDGAVHWADRDAEDVLLGKSDVLETVAAVGAALEPAAAAADVHLVATGC